MQSVDKMQIGTGNIQSVVAYELLVSNAVSDLIVRAVVCVYVVREIRIGQLGPTIVTVDC